MGSAYHVLQRFISGPVLFKLAFERGIYLISPLSPGYHYDCNVAFANWEARATRSYQAREGGRGGRSAHIVSLVMRAKTWHFASRNTLFSIRWRTHEGGRGRRRQRATISPAAFSSRRSCRPSANNDFPRGIQATRRACACEAKRLHLVSSHLE